MARMTLADFIDQEISARKISGRKFAELVGVENSTIVRARDPRFDQEPTLGFLVKLARATETPIQTIVAMVVPEDVSNLDPRVNLLAERIANLSETKREQVEAFILGLRLQQPQKFVK